MIQEKEFEEGCETWLKCETIEDFREFCEAGGWGDEHGFEMGTGFSYEKMIMDRWFLVLGTASRSQVFLK